MSSTRGGIAGIGMTSARTRDRLVERLRAHGIRSEAVLSQIRNVPRHLFVDGFEGEKVLEIGTGCGYQTAVLASLVKKIYSVERIPELLRRAKQRLRDLDIYNVQFRPGDGWEGWPKYAPYDGIIVAAAASVVPEKLLDQLAPGGRLVMPVGAPGYQELMLVTRQRDHFEKNSLGGVSFVPLVHN
jgi:protein-L-isoaspartate(D-aspartate) O-methyltransferase